MNDFSPADLAAVMGGNRDGDGWGGDSGLLWLVLFIMLGGGFGNRGYGGTGAGAVGGDGLYPWMNLSERVGDGTGILQQAIAGLAQQLCGCCGDMQMAVSNGFANAETAASARQMANMQQQFGMQTAVMQGFNALQAQQAQCCCDARLETANQTAALLAEHCSDRAALSDGIRDVIQAQNAGTQRILDQMCADKIDAKNEEIANLRQQVNMMNLAASQQAQTAQLLADNFAQTNALEQYLAPVPCPAYIVQNPNCCQQGFGCGCSA